MPNRTAQRIKFGRFGRRVIEANFDGGDLSSDGELLLLRRVDERIGLTRAVAAVFGDGRDRKYPDFCVLRLVEKWDEHMSTAGRFGRFSRTANRPAVGECVAACYAV
ncbi:MAG: hypothetical protein OHK0044_22640 [Burkholderiaceae bacterium]